MNLSELYALSDAQRLPSYGDRASERPSTLFYADFKVAEAFGMPAVMETMENCGDLTRRNPKEVTELYMVLNRLMWEAHGRGNDRLCNYYRKTYDEIDNITDSWSDDDKQYFFSITD